MLRVQMNKRRVTRESTAYKCSQPTTVTFLSLINNNLVGDLMGSVLSRDQVYYKRTKKVAFSITIYKWVIFENLRYLGFNSGRYNYESMSCSPYVYSRCTTNPEYSGYRASSNTIL